MIRVLRQLKNFSYLVNADIDEWTKNVKKAEKRIIIKKVYDI